MSESIVPTRALGIVRAIVGILQGLALYVIYLAYDDKFWPATNGLAFAPLLLIALFAPLLLLQGLGNIRDRTLAIWLVSAICIIAVLGFYDIWHAWPEDFEFGRTTAQPHILPSPQIFLSLTGGLFIAQALIAGGDADRKVIANYPTHFDVAWKLAVQLGLAALFTGAFWALLWLGAGLFTLIKIEFFRNLIQHRWFAIPASALAFALAIHVTDVRAGIVRGIRTLGLSLLSWLLPLMTLIAGAFLVTLVFTGLQPLWNTRFATTLLLITAGALVVLINAAYQDGEPERATPFVLRYPSLLAALILLPFAGLAGYALFLRIDQYGWSTDRIYASACVFIAGFYAVGYATSALWRGPWLKRIEPWNFYGAVTILVWLLALFTPVADPFRISVESQISRLQSGKVPVGQFDFANLRWSGGRYGQMALEQLAASAGSGTDYVRQMAEAALKATNPYGRVTVPSTPETVAQRFTVHPAGGKLPATFLPQNVDPFAPCLGNTAVRLQCDAWIVDVNRDGIDDVLILQNNVLAAFSEVTPGHWAELGFFSLPLGCKNTLDALRAGTLQFVEPVPPPLPDLQVADQRFHFVASRTTPLPPCKS